jgi:transcriptional regulator with XRE-family HTH domain
MITDPDLTKRKNEVTMMTIGEKIKELRKKNDLTQEKLADYLCVSYQAVSKWECGLSSPDISLLLPLAKLFGVTTDELLGAIPDEEDNRYQELEDLYNATFQTGNIPSRLEITEAAVREYPGDMKWLNRLAWDVWCNAIDQALPAPAFEEQRARAIKLFDTVIQNTKEDDVLAHAIVGITQCLCGKGAKAEAKAYVERFPASRHTLAEKKNLLAMCMEGEEQRKQKQDNLEGALSALLDLLLWKTGGDQKDICAAVEGILRAVIPDGNFLHYHYEMENIRFRMAKAAQKEGREEEVKKLLREAKFHAAEYDKIVYQNRGTYTFTAPLLNVHTVDTNQFSFTGTSTLTDDLQEACKRNGIESYLES